MRIIPVIDLLDGRAVHARGGRRHLYRPLSTPLCRDSDPLAVATAYRGMHPFRTFYLADLNAIQDRGDNLDVVRALLRRFRGCRIWLDAGPASMEAAGVRLRPVIGTETGIDASRLGKQSKRAPPPVLSLDFRARRFLGDPAILDRPDCWPPDIIVMNLDRVGARRGPDLDRIASLKQRARSRCIYAGGGLRDEEDLRLLAAAGAAGVLTATALHERALDSPAVARWEDAKKKPRPGPGRVVG
jgi:phosphoribosylformimino-5-aminoimidazole carboxamide ribotide isomerase